MIVEFSKPTDLGGVEVSALALDLESMHGSDLIELETTYRALHKGKYIPVPDIEKGYQVLVAAFAAKVNPMVLQALPAKEMNAICSSVRDFLLG
jgi:hypothetical protein